VMLEYGAVNAANLDGGTSSSMVYEGEVITNVCSLYGERPLPTCFLVRRVEDDVE
jgi:exopolysaccharide biosynthesis protein